MGDIRYDSEISYQVEDHTKKGQQLLKEANENRSTDTYDKAIQEFILAHKNALYLNQDKNAERSCLFNLGAAYVAAGYFDRGIDVLKSLEEQAVQQIITGGTGLSQIPTYGQICFNIAVAYDQVGKTDIALNYYDKSVHAFSAQTQNKEQVGNALLKSGNINQKKGEFLQARACFSRAAAVFGEAHEYALACTALLAEVDVLIASSAKLLSIDCTSVLDRCMKQASKIDDNSEQCNIYYKLGLKYSLIGDFQTALFCFGEAQKLCAANNNNMFALVMQNMGAIYNTAKRFSTAIPFHDEAIRIHGELGNRDAQGQCLCNLAYARCQLNYLAEAEMDYRHAEMAFRDCGNKYGQWRVQDGLGGLNMMQGNPCAAVTFYQQAVKYQALTKDKDTGVQDTLVKKLTTAIEMCLMQQGTSVTTVDGGVPPPIRRRSTAIEQRDGSALEVYPARLPSYRKPRPKANNYKRGRRDYADDDLRPIQHVARGLSTLTDTSMLSRPGSRREGLRSSSSDSSDEEDANQSLRYPRAPASSLKKGDPDVPLISDVLRQNSKFHVQLTSVGEGREEADEHPTDQKNLLGETQDRNVPDAVTPRSNKSDTDYAGHYRQQMQTVEQSGNDKQAKDSSSNSSSSSSSEAEEDFAKAPSSMPRRAPPEKPPRTRLPDKPNQENTVNRPARKSLRFQDESHGNDDTHLYASVRLVPPRPDPTSSAPIKAGLATKMDATYDQPPSSSSSSSDEAEALPLYAVCPPESAVKSSPGPSQQTDGPGRQGRNPTDTLPETPDPNASKDEAASTTSSNNEKPSKKKKSGNEANSRACVVL